MLVQGPLIGGLQCCLSTEMSPITIVDIFLSIYKISNVACHILEMAIFPKCAFVVKC